MDKIDDETRIKLREWQMRRLALKDRMQSHPEQTLELSKVLDLMDEEHAAILAGATRVPSASEPELESEPAQAPAAVPPKLTDDTLAPAFDLTLRVTAHSREGLRKLLEMAVYELREEVDNAATDAPRTCPGGMSGTLGDYEYTLDINRLPKL
ncbi:hypothetical protein [Pseudomonas sp. UBA1879]|uniref:hypothetical protein n=1 Tax=Pseudomonas sp. UBA1879 TaxID=1947305 RepID=UPI0025FAA281|nr:hypothetical protein [Pseudomonas sp. UBA1879]